MPGANDPTEITVGANGQVYVAPVGTVAPTDIGTAIGAGWVLLGYVSPEGATFTVGRETEDIMVWQSFYPVRRLITAQSSTVAFELAQWNRDTIPLAFGGGTVSEVSPGAYRFTPPEPGSVDERALILAFQDGTKNYRIVMPRGMVSEDVETTLVNSTNGLLPITFTAFGSEGALPWFIDTDDPSFAPA